MRASKFTFRGLRLQDTRTPNSLRPGQSYSGIAESENPSVHLRVWDSPRGAADFEKDRVRVRSDSSINYKSRGSTLVVKDLTAVVAECDYWATWGLNVDLSAHRSRQYEKYAPILDKGVRSSHTPTWVGDLGDPAPIPRERGQRSGLFPHYHYLLIDVFA